MAHRLKFLERTSSRRRPSLHATTIAKARHSSPTFAAISTCNLNRLVATGHSELSGRLCPSVSVYLAASFSADRPSADRPREPLDNEIEQLSEQFELAETLKAATIAPQQQLASSRRFVKPSTRYGSLHDKYVDPYRTSFQYSSAHDSGVPLVASAASYTYAHARPFEHASSPGAARITERPRESRPSVAATSALPPLASNFDSAAAPLPALAASAAASQASHEALQVAA